MPSTGALGQLRHGSRDQGCECSHLVSLQSPTASSPPGHWKGLIPGGRSGPGPRPRVRSAHAHRAIKPPHTLTAPLTQAPRPAPEDSQGSLSAGCPSPLTCCANLHGPRLPRRPPSVPHHTYLPACCLSASASVCLSSNSECLSSHSECLSVPVRTTLSSWPFRRATLPAHVMSILCVGGPGRLLRAAT